MGQLRVLYAREMPAYPGEPGLPFQGCPYLRTQGSCQGLERGRWSRLPGFCPLYSPHSVLASPFRIRLSLLSKVILWDWNKGFWAKNLKGINPPLSPKWWESYWGGGLDLSPTHSNLSLRLPANGGRWVPRTQNCQFGTNQGSWSLQPWQPVTYMCSKSAWNGSVLTELSWNHETYNRC